MCCAVLLSHVRLFAIDPMDYSPPGSSGHWDSTGKNTRMGCHALLQDVYLTYVLYILYNIGRYICVYIYTYVRISVLSFPTGSVGKESAWSAGGTGDAGSIPGLGWSPGEGNGNYSSILTWKIPWTKEPGGLQSMGSQSQVQLSD